MGLERMRELMAAVGWADLMAPVFFLLCWMGYAAYADGRLELIDGHLRAETTPTTDVPVLIVDLDDREAALLLAVHDPLSALAETDEALLKSIVAAAGSVVEIAQVE